MRKLYSESILLQHKLQVDKMRRFPIKSYIVTQYLSSQKEITKTRSLKNLNSFFESETYSPKFAIHLKCYQGFIIVHSPMDTNQGSCSRVFEYLLCFSTAGDCQQFRQMDFFWHFALKKMFTKMYIFHTHTNASCIFCIKQSPMNNISIVLSMLQPYAYVMVYVHYNFKK